MTQPLTVISGGSQGLGKALAAQYTAKGHKVYIVARTVSKLEQAKASLEGDVHAIAADVSNPADCERIFKTTGVPDMVICCAGAAHTGFFVEMSSQVLAQNLSTVYDTALYFSHAAMRCIAAHSDGRRRKLVFVSSVVAVFPMVGYSAYAPAKAAIRSLADILAQEGMQFNVEVAHVMPGSMDTPGFEVENLTKPAITRKIEGASPALLPEDVAKQVVSALDGGQRTIFTDSIGWVLGASMMGFSPRAGWGVLQGLVGVLLAIFGRIVAVVINSDIRKEFSGASSGAKRD